MKAQDLYAEIPALKTASRGSAGEELHVEVC